jgi:hypothetical protein
MTTLASALDIEVPTGKKLLAILERTGEAKHVWDPTEPGDEAKARDAFDRAKSAGYTAYQIEGGGGGSVAKNFNAEAEKIVMAPQMVGG